jgi:hypothetical protein
MRRVTAVASLAAALLAGAVLAPGASAALTATEMRAGDHPAFVRVVVEFTGGRVLTGEVVATDPNPFPDGAVRLPLTRRGVRTTAAPVSAHGVDASIRQRSGRIVIRLDGAARRFKYVSYRALAGPQRLVIDLWKSRPPVAGAEVRRGPRGCLTLGDFGTTERRLTARGRERNLFEHSLAVVLRRSGGRIHAQRGVQAAGRRWSTSFRFPATRRRTGTLEAVAMSAKDGTLECLVQARVRFGG